MIFFYLLTNNKHFLYYDMLRFYLFLAHLSRRLTRWAYSIPMVRRPYVVVRRRGPSSSTLSNLNISEASWPILIKFMCSITGLEQRLQKVLEKIGSKLWFPWQQKALIVL